MATRGRCMGGIGRPACVHRSSRWLATALTGRRAVAVSTGGMVRETTGEAWSLNCCRLVMRGGSCGWILPFRPGSLWAHPQNRGGREGAKAKSNPHSTGYRWRLV